MAADEPAPELHLDQFVISHMAERPIMFERERQLQGQAILREKARHCRDLAYSIADDRTKRILLDMAQGFEKEARALDADQSNEPPLIIPTSVR